MATRKTPSAPAKRLPSFEPGYWVALTLKTKVSGLSCYVGQVQTTDEHGIRITLIDWFIGNASSWDFFAPWDMIAGAMIATPEHSLEIFGEAASRWATRCDPSEQEPSEEPSSQDRKSFKPKRLSELMKEKDEDEHDDRH